MIRLCDVEGCEGKHFAKGLCNRHYKQVRRGIDPYLTLEPDLLEDEEAREIPGYPDYLATSLGRIWSIPRYNSGGGWLTPNPNSEGYLMVTMHHEGKHCSSKVHVLVSSTFLGPRPAGMQTCHGPEGARVNSVSNLRYDTPASNAADKYRDGTEQCGERAPGAKLTWEGVDYIRQEYPTGTISQHELAEKYGVGQSTIGRIVRGESWKTEHRPRNKDDI